MPTQRLADHQVAELVINYRSGDQRCLQQLMDALSPMIRHAVRRIVNCSADVEDVIQETWLAFIRKGHTLENPERLAGWLWTTASNLARKLSIKSSRALCCGEIEGVVEATTMDSADDLFARQRSVALHLAVACLEDRDQELMQLLMSVEGHSYKAVSALSGRPIGSLGPTRDRLIHRLQKDPQLAKLAYAS